MKTRPFFITTILACLLAPSAGLAQETSAITPDPADLPLVLSGTVGQPFSASLRLTAEESDVPSFVFLPSDLKTQDGEQVLGRQNISLSGDPTLTAGVPKDFQVVVSGLTHPGVYSGQLEILIPGQPRRSALAISLEVEAKVPPALSPQAGTSPLQLRLVSCSSRLDCWLARQMLPNSSLAERRLLYFQNDTSAEAVITKAEIIANGESTGDQVSEDQLEIPNLPLTILAHEVSGLPMIINRDEIPPDHYTGALYLSLDGGQAPLSVPLDLYVRAGPLWPLVFLIVGIILGRLVKYMQERGRPQSDALLIVNRLTARLLGAHPEDQEILKPAVESLRQRVYNQKLDNLEADVQALESRLETLEQIRSIEESLHSKQQHPLVKEVLEKVHQARQHLAQGDDEQAQAAMQEAQGTLGKLRASLMSVGQPDADVTSAEARAQKAVRAAEKAAAPQEAARPPGPMDRFKAALVQLSGLSEQIRAEATLWLVRPLLYFALLSGLLLVGLNTLYVNPGLAFGSSPLSDFTGLVLWGLSADVASRSLSNLQA